MGQTNAVRRARRRLRAEGSIRLQAYLLSCAAKGPVDSERFSNETQREEAELSLAGRKTDGEEDEESRGNPRVRAIKRREEGAKGMKGGEKGE